MQLTILPTRITWFCFSLIRASFNSQKSLCSLRNQLSNRYYRINLASSVHPNLESVNFLPCSGSKKDHIAQGQGKEHLINFSHVIRHFHSFLSQMSDVYRAAPLNLFTFQRKRGIHWAWNMRAFCAKNSQLFLQICFSLYFVQTIGTRSHIWSRCSKRRYQITCKVGNARKREKFLIAIIFEQELVRYANSF